MPFLHKHTKKCIYALELSTISHQQLSPICHGVINTSKNNIINTTKSIKKLQPYTQYTKVTKKATITRERKTEEEKNNDFMKTQPTTKYTET